MRFLRTSLGYFAQSRGAFLIPLEGFSLKGKIYKAGVRALMCGRETRAINV